MRRSGFRTRSAAIAYELWYRKPANLANCFACSPHRYVIERRINRARDLLLRKEKTISEIAVAVGFSSQSHLTANFGRTMGVTPRKFRQSLD
jgi:AraC-like DNA-binding protein